MSWQLTKEEKNKLSKDDLNKYNNACHYMNMENAGGMFGGWNNGVDILISLGWTKKETNQGHRSFITLIKPKHLTDNEISKI